MGSGLSPDFALNVSDGLYLSGTFGASSLVLDGMLLSVVVDPDPPDLVEHAPIEPSLEPLKEFLACGATGREKI